MRHIKNQNGENMYMYKQRNINIPQKLTNLTYKVAVDNSSILMYT